MASAIGKLLLIMSVREQVCVGLQTNRNIASGCLRNPPWVPRLQCPAALTMPATPGFPYITFQRMLLLPRDINHARQTDHRFCPCVNVFQLRERVRDRQTNKRTVCWTADRCIPAICYTQAAAINCSRPNNAIFNVVVI